MLHQNGFQDSQKKKTSVSQWSYSNCGILGPDRTGWDCPLGERAVSIFRDKIPGSRDRANIKVSMWLDYTDRRVAKSGQSELWQGFLISHVPSFHGCYRNGTGSIHYHLTTACWLDSVHLSFKFYITVQPLR